MGQTWLSVSGLCGVCFIRSHYVINSFGLFFSGASKTVVVVGVKRFFALCVGVALC